ncbi:glycosyltransferase [Flavobacterium gilvum]|uniref:Glycosyl transferase family 1 n=1 Tax=Flavobacterium gilvum TaxID=1492737 RepID=A0AAC9I342_9FLAO|nr:glycosyltransferase [Flavobacterium gilvum]AOW08700.1 glycosyl transferase family 1 [Flavobacterium gilvum]KFC59869.1 glycosyl transferase family 1 [Flavobacterium gilvum]
MKVVHIIEALGGGVYTYFKDLSHYFGEDEIAKDISTTIIYSGNRKEIDPEKIEAEFSKGVSSVKINMVRKISPVQDFKSVLQLRKELKKLNPDVIHLHSSKAGVLGRIACFLLFKRKKIFYTPHGYAFLRTDISPLTQKIYWFIEKSFQLVFGGATIACGDSEYNIAKGLGKSYLIRNGINIQAVQQQFTKPQNKTLTIGILARITTARTPKLFNEIALGFPQYNFAWIGDGELKHELTAKNIVITGWFMDRNKALQKLSSIDIYIQTSLWEGLPIAVLEAMALQKPVLATNIIGNKDIVVHNETGFLFTKIEELDTYFEILKEETIRNDFGKKGLERCQRLFDINQNFKNLITIYQQ